MEWERRIGVFKASGQTQSKWCPINNLSLHQLRYWLKKIESSKSKPEPSAKWIPVSLEEFSEGSAHPAVTARTII